MSIDDNRVFNTEYVVVIPWQRPELDYIKLH